MLTNKAFGSSSKELIQRPFKIPRPSLQKSGSQIREEKKKIYYLSLNVNESVTFQPSTMKQEIKIFFLIFLKIINVSVGADDQKRSSIFAGVKEDPIKNYVSMFREQNRELRAVSLNAEDTSKFRTKREVTEEILLDFAFSVQKPMNLKETSKTPIKGMALCYNFYNFLIN
jgi:hypothetical protein